MHFQIMEKCFKCNEKSKDNDLLDNFEVCFDDGDEKKNILRAQL